MAVTKRRTCWDKEPEGYAYIRDAFQTVMEWFIPEWDLEEWTHVKDVAKEEH